MTSGGDDARPRAGVAGLGVRGLDLLGVHLLPALGHLVAPDTPQAFQTSFTQLRRTVQGRDLAFSRCVDNRMEGKKTKWETDR